MKKKNKNKNKKSSSYDQQLYATNERLSNARVKITIDFPFFGYLLAGLEFIPQDINGLTMATDGNVVFYSPNFLTSLENSEFMFVVCHEVLHCAFEHIPRCKEREQMIWNIAVDIVTNEILVKNNIGFPPDKCVRADLFLPKSFYQQSGILNKSAEEIYRELTKNAKKITASIQTSGPPNFDQHYDAKSGLGHSSEKKEGKGTKGKDDKNKGSKGDKKQKPSKTLAETLDKLFKESKKKHPITDWCSKLSQATVFAKTRGSTPAGVGQEIEIAIKGIFPWQRILAQYIQQTLAYDSSFSHPNRRLIHSNLYLPGPEKSGLKVVVAIDTSGSINEEEASKFLGETFAILGMFPRVDIMIIQCDAAIQGVENYSNWDMPPKKFEFKGRGGTDFRPVFNYLKDKAVQTDVLIYLTDGWGSFPDKKDTPMNLPVIWVLTNKEVKVPFGERIYFPS